MLGVPVLAGAAIAKIPQTGGLITSKHSFVTVLEVGKSKIKVQIDLASVEGQRPVP